MDVPSRDQLPIIAELLSNSGLPTDDLDTLDLSLFRIYVSNESSESINAVGGIEPRGPVALLRSIATDESARGRGLAGSIVEALEAIALSERFESLYLLTESADAYFSARGYEVVERVDVPASIRQSRQFSTLCPDSAIVMRKHMAN